MQKKCLNAWLIGLQTADILVTWVALHNARIAEGNPLIASLIGCSLGWWQVVALKLGLVTAFCVFASRKGALLMIGIYTIVILWNLQILWQL